METENVFATSNLYLAAFLKSAGFGLIETRVAEGPHPKVTFLMEDRPDRRDLVSGFFAETLLAESRPQPKLYQECIREFKDLLYKTLNESK